MWKRLITILLPLLLVSPLPAWKVCWMGYHEALGGTGNLYAALGGLRQNLEAAPLSWWLVDLQFANVAQCVFLLGVGVALHLALRKRGASGGAGVCARCRYDLRATPDRCPECGLNQQERPDVPVRGGEA